MVIWFCGVLVVVEGSLDYRAGRGVWSVILLVVKNWW